MNGAKSGKKRSYRIMRQVISLALKRLSQYIYKLVSTYYIRWISRFGLMENDNKNKSSVWNLAICLLEKHLTRANRAQKYEQKNR
jgi:hypothetical protein